MNKRSFDDKCPFCGEEFLVKKMLNYKSDIYYRPISFYDFSCGQVGGQIDHVVHDYVSLYLKPTFCRRITLLIGNDSFQLNIDFTTNKCTLSVDFDKIKSIMKFEPDYKSIMNDCDNLKSLINKLEIYQIFS